MRSKGTKVRSHEAAQEVSQPLRGVAPDAFLFSSPGDALAALLPRVRAVETERVAWTAAAGRVLAEPIFSDRDSPPCDVSAMDGYALRQADLSAEVLVVAGEAPIGRPPPPLPPGRALRIFTGAAIPPGAELVIRREDVQEGEQQITLSPAARSATPGQNIRRQGENLRAGQGVLGSGSLITPAGVSSLVAFGRGELAVHRRVRIGILATGDELLPIDASPQPWQIRESNGPALATMFAQRPWLHVIERDHVPDVAEQIQCRLAALLEACDAVVLSGGVSAGQYDYVPGIIRSVGAEVVFHKLPIRPGKPILGAIGPGGQVIFGLPGNPVSVLVTARRFLLPVLSRLAGIRSGLHSPTVTIVRSDGRTIPLWWHRLVRLTGPGEAELTPMQGSGDIPAAALSDGFVEIPPDTDAAGTWSFYDWRP